MPIFRSAVGCNETTEKNVTMLTGEPVVRGPTPLSLMTHPPGDNDINDIDDDNDGDDDGDDDDDDDSDFFYFFIELYPFYKK